MLRQFPQARLKLLSIFSELLVFFLFESVLKDTNKYAEKRIIE